jgi:hypothetical protein
VPVPASIDDLSQTPASNYPLGSEPLTTADDYFRTYAAFIAELRDKVSEVVSVFDFMTQAEKDDVTAGTRTLDHTAAVTLAINYANSLGNGTSQFPTLEFPPGGYSITPGALPAVLCDIDGPRAGLFSNTNAAGALITIGVAPGLALQKIRLFSLTGYAFAYSFTDPRYGIGLGFSGAAGEYISQLQVDIGFIQGFGQGIGADCSVGFHIGTNIFNIQTLWYCTSGIYSVSGNLEFENNTFNIQYVTACNPAVYSGSVGTHSNCQNIYNIACLELHNIVGTTGISLAGSNTNQNIFNIASMSYNVNTTWIVSTDGNAWGNHYHLPGVDVTKLFFVNDVLKSDGIGPINPTANDTRSVMYGANPVQNYPGRDGDRYIVNSPSAGNVASYIRQGAAWVPETYSELSGTFTLTGTGFTAGVSTTASYKVINGRVFLFITQNAITGTSNATTFTLTGLPAGIRPVSSHVVATVQAQDNGATVLASATVDPSGVITLGKGLLGGAWTAAGTKGLYSTDLNWSLD